MTNKFIAKLKKLRKLEINSKDMFQSTTTNNTKTAKENSSSKMKEKS